jgi:serine/threonine protein kinase
MRRVEDGSGSDMKEELKTLASLTDSHRERDTRVVEPCLNNDEILAFAQGYLPDHQLDRVHAHVDACSACQRLVAEAAHALDAEPISESARPSWNTVFQANSVVGKRYLVLRLVARGGMGEVYEAFDTELQEHVAIKTVTSTACDSIQAVRYLKAEVQLARRVSHCNVCRIYDFGTHEMAPSGGEVHFLVMEFVEGQCLGKKLREGGALPIELCQSIAHQLLLGLRAAHEAGILHRDFKSDNVMLRTDGNGKMTPVILDFGLAKALNESGLIATTRHQGQSMIGTIGYMAPEQVEGEPLSTSSDLYAFGVVWFEMLTGRLPFEGDTPVAAAMARLRRPPVPPSRLNSAVPKWLDDIVLRCLSRHRVNRFSTAQQVLEALEKWPSAPSSARRSPRRQQRWAVGTLVIIAGTAAMSLASLWQPPNLSAAPWRVASIPTQRPSGVVLPSKLVVSAVVQPSDAVADPKAPSHQTQRVSSKPQLARAAVPTEIHAKDPQPHGTAPKATVSNEGPSTIPEPSPAASRSRTPDWLPVWTKKGSSKP